MRKSALILLVLFVVFLGAAPAPAVDANAWSRVFINGQMTPVSFNDGDSFRVQAGEFSGAQCRLGGYNTLESFGPGHQWGDWHPYELYVTAKQATYNGRRGTWHCFTDGRRDGYGRLLMDCPDLAYSQIVQGFAHAYQIDDTPTRPEYLRAMHEAIEARRGIWAHGVPDYVMTSVHSASEDPQREWHYNRLVSTHDGHSESYRHHENYDECEWVCNEEIRADESAVAAAARALRADPQIGPGLAEYQNFHLLEFARRFARLGELPEYLTGDVRALVEARLTADRAEGRLGTTHQERGSCMLYVDFTRRYGGDRASCLRGHGSVPPGANVPGAGHGH